MSYSPLPPFLAMLSTSRVLWGLVWLLVVVTPSVVVLEAQRSARPLSRGAWSRRDFLLGCLLVPGVTAVGVFLAAAAWHEGHDSDRMVTEVLGGTFAGVGGCFAVWTIGLIDRAFALWTKRPAGKVAPRDFAGQFPAEREVGSRE